jgi:GT2 family glycosyltransferase
MTVSRPLISVIVVNWNGAAFLEECVASIVGQSYPRIEAIVVDNGSTDGSVELVKQRFGARVRLIESPTNRGFAGGNNLAIRIAEGAYVALLNSDATADARWVATLVDAAETDPRIGMCASRIYLQGSPRVLDSAGLLLSRDGIGRGRGRLQRDQGQFSTAEDVLLPSGCAALYRRAMLDEIGLFDEDFFAYCDDTDLGLRARLAGWRCRYVPDAIVHHRYSASTAPHSAFKAFQVERNRVWIVVKYFPPGLMVTSVAYTLLRYALQAYGAFSRKGAAGRLAEGTSVAAIGGLLVRAYAAAFARLPAMWRRRRQVEALRRVGRRELSRWLRTHRVGLAELALTE